MPPKRTKASANAWQDFNKTLAKARKERGRIAVLGSGFDLADADASSRNVVYKTVKYVKVRTVGRSVFSSLALRFEVDMEDPNPGMGLEIVEVVEDEEAMRAVEMSGMTRQRQREEELEAEEEAKKLVDGGKARKMRLVKGRTKAKTVEYHEEEDAGINTRAGGFANGDDTDEDEPDRIKIPARTVSKKASDGFV